MIDSQYPMFIDPNLLPQGELPQDEAHHAIHVLRKKVGDKIYITNGKGTISLAFIEKITKKEFIYHVTESFNIPKPAGKLHLAIAPTKNIDRFEYMAEKCTEIGFDSLFPIICANSERKFLKTDRIERIVWAAVKQSLKAYLPTIHPPMEYSTFINTTTLEPGYRYIAICNNTPTRHFFSELMLGDDTYVLIGPEGDFSNAEIRLALENGFKPVSLGESRLRTETAAIVACHTHNLKQNLFNNK